MGVVGRRRLVAQPGGLMLGFSLNLVTGMTAALQAGQSQTALRAGKEARKVGGVA